MCRFEVELREAEKRLREREVLEVVREEYATVQAQMDALWQSGSLSWDDDILVTN